MSIHHDIPTDEDLARLSARTEDAISIYLPASPHPQERQTGQVALKSAVDEAIRRLRSEHPGPERPAAVLDDIRSRWQDVDSDPDVWGRLSASLAVFLAPTTERSPGLTEVFVLPNHLQYALTVGDHFDVGQLLRSVTYPHEAWALTLSANRWTLWHATAEARIAPVPVLGDHPDDANEASHRNLERGRGDSIPLGRDEGRKLLLDQYAHRVSDAVTFELNARHVPRDVPFFLFAAEPLLSQFTAHFLRTSIPVSGAADTLGADDLDDRVRQGLDSHYTALAEAEVARIADDSAAGLVATEPDRIARAAVQGAVDTLLFNFTVELLGRIDETTGALELLPGGEQSFPDGGPADDVLARIAVLVLRQGGQVLAVRGDEVSGPIWNRLAVAHLRHTVA